MILEKARISSLFKVSSQVYKNLCKLTFVFLDIVRRGNFWDIFEYFWDIYSIFGIFLDYFCDILESDR
jgi:hypothetical protein